MIFVYFFKPCLRTFSIPFGLLTYFPFATGANIDAPPCVCKFVGWVGGDASFKIQALQTTFCTHLSSFKVNKYTKTTKFCRVYREKLIGICSSLSGSTIFCLLGKLWVFSPTLCCWKGVGTQYHMGIKKQLYGELIYEQELTGWWEGDESASPREDKEIFQTLPWISPTQTQHLFLAPVIHHFFLSQKPSIAGSRKPMKMALLGANQLILHPASGAQSLHECQVSPRHPECFCVNEVQPSAEV